jgi:hypothetical protein
VAGSNNCDLVQIADGTTGATISYGQPRYGTGLDLVHAATC